MSEQTAVEDVFLLTELHDKDNLKKIEENYQQGRIDKATRVYLDRLYTNSMNTLKEVFLCIGKSFGAPKAAVMEYDYTTNAAIEKNITMYSINPLKPYIVNHRLDADPMRNQFFTSTQGHQIDLAVSSIVTVIVGAQKSLSRALDKVTGKYYTSYTQEVADIAYSIILSETDKASSAKAISDKIKENFSKSFVTDASECILGIIGSGHQKISAELVRALDKIKTPYERLTDVWRVKCLFDLVPQARTFMERVCNMWPDKVIEVKDKFFDITNPRGYRDAKIILNIGSAEKVIPLEIICQVRTFFEFECQTHTAYEKTRRAKNAESACMEEKLAKFMRQGVNEYNLKIQKCTEDLFDRIGWNILYSNGDDDLLFDGFPKIGTIYYPQTVVDKISEKVISSVENEVFFVPDAPIKLTKDQQIRIFLWMTRFLLVTAMPYSDVEWSVPTDTIPGKFFHFIMNEVQRYYKK
ncbi:MAG: hypothetical protein MJ156_02105 [Alphaproteobacteria bacterium]|nr:hypothetical protein [Alphaproteobacteria bacterium]